MVAIFADSNRARIRYAKESDSTWGVTPTSGITRELRYTSSTFNAQKATTTSDEIRADRMISDIVETSKTSTGDINIEFSAGSHDDFLEGFSYGFWTREMTFDSWKGTIVAFGSSSTIVVSGIDLTEYLVAGGRIRTSGFTNPANNDYFQISTVAYSGGNTTITTTTSGGVTEAGSVTSSLFDANDVIILKSTAIRCGTSGASTFDSNSGNAFASAISAGQLNVGQKIYIDGLGYQTQTITMAAYTSEVIVAGAYVTVNDGTNSQNFQFGGTLGAGNIAVAVGAANTNGATNLAAAINAARVAGLINVSATVSAGVTTVKSQNASGLACSATGDTNTNMTFGTASAANSTARGIFTITSLASDVIGVTPQPPTLNNSTLGVTVKGSMLRNPSIAADIVPHSFAFETGFEDVGQYFVTNGQRVGTFSYDVASNAILKGSFGFQGRSTLNADVSTFGNAGTYTVRASTSTDVANATVNVGFLLMNNEELSTAVQSISLKGTNNLRNQMAIGDAFPAGIGSGRIEITGTVVAYFADATLWNNFINHDTVSLNYPLTDADNNHYEFTVPSVVFSTDTVNPAGRDQDIIETMEFMAKRDPNTACTIQIDRFSNISSPTS